MRSSSSPRTGEGVRTRCSQRSGRAGHALQARAAPATGRRSAARGAGSGPTSGAAILTAVTHSASGTGEHARPPSVTATVTTPIGTETPFPTATVTTPPVTTTAATATPTTGGGGAATVDLIAENLAFDTSTITVPAGAEVTVNFDNQDDGIPHNVAVYTDSSAAEEIFVGEIITGGAGLSHPHPEGNF